MRRGRILIIFAFLIIAGAIALISLRPQPVQLPFVATVTPTAPLPAMHEGDVWRVTATDHQGPGGALRVEVVAIDGSIIGAEWYLAPAGTEPHNTPGECALRMIGGIPQLSVDISKCRVA